LCEPFLRNWWIRFELHIKQIKMFCFCLTVFNVDIHISLKLLQNFGRLNKHGWAGVASWMCICF